MDDSLRGKLLVASPALVDPNFARAVVLITEHNDDGAMGIVLNRPSDAHVGEVVPQLADVAGAEAPIYVGGPGAAEALVVLAEFTDPEAAAWIVVADVGLASADLETADLGVGRRAARASTRATPAGARASSRPRSRWTPGSSSRRCPRELFPDEPDTLWNDVLARKGGQYALVARMPEDPSLN